MATDENPDLALRSGAAFDARHAQGVQVGDGNTQYNQYGSVVRSAYLEQVRRIAPAVLEDRERELAELAAFCTDPERGPYVWWQAAADVGTSALMSWFALNPPPGVRVVPFFVTARYAGQSDRGAFIDVVLEQLAEMLGQSMPAHLTEATREAHLLGMLGAAAQACQQRGQRLVLIVDGLNEDRAVTTGSESYSIAALLPVRPVAGMRIIVAGRPDLAIPADVPDGHPLRDPGVVRALGRLADPAEQARQEAVTAARAEERQRWEQERRRAEQARLEQERHLQDWAAAEAERLSLAARARASGLALAVTGGWTLALILAVWLTWGLYDSGIGVILTGQALAVGVGGATSLVPRAARLGSAYRPELGTPASWIPRGRAAIIVGAVTCVVTLVSGLIASDYLLARHERLTSRDPGILPSFDELVVMAFILLAVVACAGVGRYAGLTAVHPWEELHRSRERAHRAARAEARRAAAMQDSATLARDALSPDPVARASAYRGLLRRLGGTAEREPPGRN
jgi:hypothetical protein